MENPIYMNNETQLRTERATRFLESLLRLHSKFISPSSPSLIETRNNLIEIAFDIKDNTDMDPLEFFRVSTVFREKVTPNMTELSEALTLPNSTTTRYVASWIKHGLVERISDHKDGRFVRVKLTGKGQETIDAMNRFAIDTIAETLDVLTGSEQIIFLLLLKKLASG